MYINCGNRRALAPPHTHALAFYSANLVVHVNVAMGYGYTNHLHRHCTDNIDV